MPKRPLPPEALALARWTALLMGWVWLGAQGQRLGWSVTSGVLPVALWWALRLLFAQVSVAARPTPFAAPLLGAATAMGALLVGQWQTPSTGHPALLVLATVWAAWSASLEAPAARGACRRRWAGGPPLLAAALTALCSTGMLPAVYSLWAAPLVLLSAAVPSSWITLLDAPRLALTAPTAPTASSVLPATAMGLMMGTLWLGNAWCSAAGWSPATVVLWHLGAMAALPALIGRFSGRPKKNSTLSGGLVQPWWGALTRLDMVLHHRPAPWAGRLPLALLALGAGVLLAGTDAAHGLVGMGLLALAWSVQAGRDRIDTFPAKPGAIFSSVAWTLGGPALLLAVGWLSPTTGRGAQQLAYGLIGAAALLALVFSGWRPALPHPTPLARSDSP